MVIFGGLMWTKLPDASAARSVSPQYKKQPSVTCIYMSCALSSASPTLTLCIECVPL